MEFETVIGLEVHAQLLTESKMFCRCATDYDNDPPNTHVCPVCLGMPGVLPTVNRRAVEFTIMTALALHCSVSERTKFDRKNYPYPDLVKGYQISQFDEPVGLGGWLDIVADGKPRRAGITRVHLEEDVGKLLHRGNGDSAYSLVDFNRAGMPLMEVVGEPDLRTPEEARQYLIQLRSILQYLGVSTGNMEEGSFRCDANISLRPVGATELTTKVEVKNMNSFRAVYGALVYEIKRQSKAYETGERIVQETRGWVDDTAKTVSQRSKEYANDYRYFPEPDLPPLTISADWIAEVRATLPELPEQRRARFVSDMGLSDYDAALLTASRGLADYFEDIPETKEFQQLPADKGYKTIANWINGECSRIMNENSITVEQFRLKVTPENLAGLALKVEQKEINTTTGKSVLEQMFAGGGDAGAIISAQGLGQISDDGAIATEVAAVIEANPKAVADYHAGKDSAVKFLVGQVMRATRGRANPQVVTGIIKEKLGAS
jgi:aspartyl-tRNA(Asn)/glutamyl-tRNA(Gln) amidotransferase subunit B